MDDVPRAFAISDIQKLQVTNNCIYLYILCIYFLYSVNMIIKWYDDNKIKA